MNKKEIFERIIELIREVIDKNLDPFQIDVVELFERIEPYVKSLEKEEELLIDVQTIHEIARLIVHQKDWIKYRASLLYLDPLLTLIKIQSLDKRELARIFLKSWHPIIEREQLTNDSLKVAIEYWRNLPTLEERRPEFPGGEDFLTKLDRRDLTELGLTREEFNQTLINTWKKLRQIGEVDYWEFIFAETFEETVQKAYAVSFLASLGYVLIEVDPLREEVKIIPLEKPINVSETKSKSLAIPISFEKWVEVKKKIEESR